MKSLFTLAISLCLTACSSAPKNPEQEYSKAFNVPYESLWRATQQALLNYPMNINNMDTGHLQTLYITGKHRFKAPHLKKVKLASGYQYRLNINILKGEKRSRVTIIKQVRLQKDFFSEPKDLISDGFEEKVLLYRIKREVIIEALLKKQMAKSKTVEKP